MCKIRRYILFIKTFPFGLVVGTILNVICLIGDSYNKVFYNNIFNFLLCEIAILMIYSLLYFKSYND